MSVLCVLPARISSRRLPRKPLREISGRPLVEWSWRAARRVEEFDEVWVATDSGEIAERVRSFGGVAVVTGDHPSGTDRVAEAARRPEARSYEIVVNYQADEPFLDPGAVGRAVRAVRDDATVRGPEIATLAAPLRDPERWREPAVVKVVRRRDGEALYFSRAPVPFPRDGDMVPGAVEVGGGDEAPPFLRHVGVYVFRRPALERWTALPPSRLEEIERLEQLRALEAGMSIHVVVGPDTEPGIDVPGDLERAERILGGGPAIRGG